MKVFRKKLMMERLERENKTQSIDDECIEIMNKLDGKEVVKNDWEDLLHGRLEYIARDEDGNKYPINCNDVEEVIVTKNKDRWTR